MTAALARSEPARDDVATRIETMLDSGFLAEAGWNPETAMLAPSPGHPLLSRGICQIPECGVRAESRGMCASCNQRFRLSNLNLDAFIQVPRDTNRKGLEGICLVPNCPRVRRQLNTGLCSGHNTQYHRRYRHLPISEFVVQPLVTPQRDFGECQVSACFRHRNTGNSFFCQAHSRQWTLFREQQPEAGRQEWARRALPIASGHVVAMRGLPPQVILELLFGLQVRCRQGMSTQLSQLRSLVQCTRQHSAASVFELPKQSSLATEQLLTSVRTALSCALSSPEQERRKDVWNLRVFGHRGELPFTAIKQRWLREAAKRWASEDLPRRRGRHVNGTLRSRIASLARLSDSLDSQRDDHGNAPARLSRRDIENFLNRMAFLHNTGEISAAKRLTICRDVAGILRDMHDLGLTHPGEPAAELPAAFTLRRKTDFPAEVAREGQGRALPQAVMRQLYDALPQLGSPSSHHLRIAVEAIMDTGRRPDEIFQIGFNCLDTDDDGKYVLIYTDFKNNREERRLPITDATATLLREQQRLVRDRFPDTPPAKLKLFPAPHQNFDGTHSLSEKAASNAHLKWVSELPPLLLTDNAELDKTAVTLYAYRHSYAQRHADAGTSPDVLRDLLGHEDIGTTQTYYRVTEKRLRSAVDKVIAFQLDRHGNRVWPEAKALLDHEHARLRVGAVAVPFGTCSEPSNVKAGGHACPFRFRCLGCGHFRTDPSYLPELRDYLHTLLRNRERIRAATDLDSWAAVEATPSEEEISRLRALIRRTEQSIENLTDEDRAALEEATRALRKVRQVVNLGMPSTAPQTTDPRLERNA